MVSKKVIALVAVIGIILIIVAALVIGLIFSNIGNEVKVPSKYVITVTKRTTAKPTASYQIVVTKGLTLVRPDVLDILRRWDTSTDEEKELVEAYREIVRERIESFLKQKVLRLDAPVARIFKTLSTTSNNLTVTDVNLSAQNDVDLIDVDYTIVTQSQSTNEASQLVNTTSEYLYNNTAYIDLVIDNSTIVTWNEPSIQVDLMTTTKVSLTTTTTTISALTVVPTTVNQSSLPATSTVVSSTAINLTAIPSTISSVNNSSSTVLDLNVTSIASTTNPSNLSTVNSSTSASNSSLYVVPPYIPDPLNQLNHTKIYIQFWCVPLKYFDPVNHLSVFYTTDNSVKVYSIPPIDISQMLLPTNDTVGSTSAVNSTNTTTVEVDDLYGIGFYRNVFYTNPPVERYEFDSWSILVTIDIPVLNGSNTTSIYFNDTGIHIAGVKSLKKTEIIFWSPPENGLTIC